MKLNKEKMSTLVELHINNETVAMCEDRDGFMKLMVFYRHGQPVWAHKDCVVAEQARLPAKSKKNRKKGLTKRQEKV